MHIEDDIVFGNLMLPFFQSSEVSLTMLQTMLQPCFRSCFMTVL